MIMFGVAVIVLHCLTPYAVCMDVLLLPAFIACVAMALEHPPKQWLWVTATLLPGMHWIYGASMVSLSVTRSPQTTLLMWTVIAAAYLGGLFAIGTRRTFDVVVATLAGAICLLSVLTFANEGASTVMLLLVHSVLPLTVVGLLGAHLLADLRVDRTVRLNSAS